jgi:hypothetical protein
MNTENWDPKQSPPVGLPPTGPLRSRVCDIQERTTARLVAFGVVLALGISVGTAALVLFAKVVDEVMEHETLVLDTATLLWMRQFKSPVTDIVMRGASLTGVVVMVLVVLAVRRQWANVASLLLVVVGAQVLNTLLKATFQRERPMPSLEHTQVTPLSVAN